MKLNIYRRFLFRRRKLIYCVIAGAIALFSISYNIGERLYIKNSAETDKTVFGGQQENTQNINSEIIIYETLEGISNDIMNARNRNENIDFISKDKLIAIRSIIEKMEYGDRGYVLNVLDRWDKRDFSLVVEQHNYFYLRLRDNNIETN